MSIHIPNAAYAFKKTNEVYQKYRKNMGEIHLKKSKLLENYTENGYIKTISDFEELISCFAKKLSETKINKQ